MSRRSLLTVFAVASFGLAACGGAETVEDVAAPPPTATATATAEPAAGDPTEATPPVVEDEGPGTDTVPAAPAAAEFRPVEPVTLAFDGHAVPVAVACTGADGAILATTPGEVTITLVREDGVALRYAAEGTSAETGDVAVDGGTDMTTYTATLSSADVAPVEVAMVVMDDASFAIETC